MSEFWDLGSYFFEAPQQYDDKALKNWSPAKAEIISRVIEVMTDIEDFTSPIIEAVVKRWMTENEIGMGKVMQPLRLSIVGALKGPHLFDIIEMIGKQETLQRMQNAVNKL